MYHCGRCTRSFESLNALGLHTANSPLHNVCLQCECDLPTREDLADHYAFTHGQRSAYGSEYGRDSHDQDRLDEDKGEDYFCSACGKFYNSDSDLRDHYLRRHGYGSAPHSAVSESRSQTSELRQYPGRNDYETTVSYTASRIHVQSRSCSVDIPRGDANAVTIIKLDHNRLAANADRSYVPKPTQPPILIARSHTVERVERHRTSQTYIVSAPSKSHSTTSSHRSYRY